MTPPPKIILQKVDQGELRRAFNDPAIRADLTRRTCQRVESYSKLAPVNAGQLPGTTSHVHDWYECDQQTGKTLLIASVHFYRNADGTIGASGQPDPQQVLLGNTLLVDP